jgi:hypothetical protein
MFTSSTVNSKMFVTKCKDKKIEMDDPPSPLTTTVSESGTQGSGMPYEGMNTYVV